MDEFRLNKLGLGVSAQNLRALGDDGGPSASASTSEVREANEQDEFIFCLLYTSPSPRDATLSRMPSSA